MIREKTSHLEWFTEEDSIYEEDVYEFKYAILEVKLCNGYIENPPEWIEKLMSSDLVIEQDTFSVIVCWI